MPKNYLVLDFETTGLDYKTEQVTEVGVIKYDEDFNEIGMFHTYVRLQNDRVLSDFIKKHTGITEDKLAYGMNEEIAMAVIEAMIEYDTVVVAQFAPFDFGYLSNYGILPSNYICTKTLTDIAEPYERSNLGETCERNGIVLKDAHTAMGDVRATKELLQLRLSQGLEVYHNHVTEQPDRPLRFMPHNTVAVLDKEDFK